MSLPESPKLGEPSLRRAMAAVACAIFLAVIDSAIANVALPTIAGDLHASPASAIWIVNAYQLAIVVCLFPAASLGEIHGYARVYRIGLAIFTVASLACALASSLPMLALARTLQGVGAAGIMSVNLALLRFIHAPDRLGRGIAINALIVGSGSAAGPTVAGLILSAAPWPALFLVNLPIGAAALALSVGAFPATPRADRRFDAPSALLNAVAFGGLVGGVEKLARDPSPAGAALAALGLAALVALLRRQRREAAPLLPVDLLAIRAFRAAMGASSLAFAGTTATLLAVPFLLEQAGGRSPAETGLLMTPWPLGVMAAAPLVGRVADRFPVGILASVGLALNAVGLALLATMPADASDAAIALRMTVAGIGFAVFQTPNNRAMLRASPPSRAGSAGGMLAMARLCGQTAGALAVAILFARGASPRAVIAATIVPALLALLLSARRILPAHRRETEQHP